MHRLGGGRVALGQERVRRVRAEVVVALLPAIALTGRRRRRQLELGERGAEVEAAAPRDDGRTARREKLVDRLVREPLVLAHRRLVVERPDADEPRRPCRLVREDRQAAVDLRRVGRDHLAAERVGDELCDVGLAARRRPEDGDHERARAARAAFRLVLPRHVPSRRAAPRYQRYRRGARTTVPILRRK